MNNGHRNTLSNITSKVAQCETMNSLRHQRFLSGRTLMTSMGLQKLKCYKAIGLWLACVVRVMDARGSLFSTRETRDALTYRLVRL